LIHQRKTAPTQEIHAMAHSNTILSQVLQLIPRHQFQTCVDRHKGDHRIRKLTCWGQFIALLSGQLARRDSLRDLIETLSSNQTALYHAGFKAVKRSTLADANANRSHEIYRDLFYKLSAKIQNAAPKYKLKLSRKLYALDSTFIELCLSVFPWAQFRQKKGAIKLHVLLDLDGLLPAFLNITDGKTHDVTAAKKMKLPKGSMVACDRAYVDYKWLYTLQIKGIRFVTRMKSNAQYRVVKSRKVDKSTGLRCDQTIRLTGVQTKKKYPGELRRISYRDPETGKRLVFLTNDFALDAKTVAAIYKARWEIELFFKTIKQNLKIKTFLGTSPNAVLTQVWIAMIAYRLLAWMKFMSKTGMSVQQIKRLIEMNLFQRRDLRDLIQRKWLKPPKPTVSPQLNLAF